MAPNRATIFVTNYLLRPPLLAVRAVLRPLYWLLFGWWGERYFLAKENEKLTREVTDTFSFLFAERNATCVPSRDIGHLARLKCPIVTVAASGLIFRFVRWRDDSQLHVASDGLPNEWHDLAEILNSIEPDSFSRYSIHSFEEAAQALKRNFDLVKDAFSPEHYPKMKNQLELAYRTDMAITKIAENEINRRLYPNKQTRHK